MPTLTVCSTQTPPLNIQGQSIVSTLWVDPAHTPVSVQGKPTCGPIPANIAFLSYCTCAVTQTRKMLRIPGHRIGGTEAQGMDCPSNSGTVEIYAYYMPYYKFFETN